MRTLKDLIDNLVSNTKNNKKDLAKISISEAWKILQLVTAEVISFIEYNNPSLLDGKNKKELALLYIEKFYDTVFVIIGIPFVPSLLEPIIHKYVKRLLMTLVGSTIDALVITFRRTGFFTSQETVDINLEPKPKVSDK